MSTSPLDHARALFTAGYAVGPVPFCEKGSVLRGWPDLRLTETDLPHYFNGTPMNIAVLTGSASGGRVDIDVDHECAVALADEHLPTTGAIWGRASKPKSHRMYTSGLGSEQFQAVRMVTGEDGKVSRQTLMIIEIRGDRLQSLAPGSVHPSGESVRWDAEGEPAVIEPGTLRASVITLADAAFEKANLAADGWTRSWASTPCTLPTSPVAPGSSCPIDNFLAALGSHGLTPKKTTKGWICRCPAHDDTNPSLSISVGADGRVLLKCFTGCPVEDIVSAVGVQLRSLFPASQAALPGDLSATNGSDSEDEESEGGTQSERLTRLALELFRFGRTTADEPFAVPIGGPNVVVLFRKSPRNLLAPLCKAYRATYRKIPNANARTDALLALEGECLDAQPEEVHLRVARHDGSVVIDMGRADGQVIHIKGGSWSILPVSPVLFRRTCLTSEMPMPERGGSLEEFRRLVNITPADWSLYLGWWVSAWYPGIPHCIMMLGGEQGTGKSTLARFAVQVVDPSPAPLRGPPAKLDDWVVAASGSWVVVLDNLSDIPVWLADAICRAVTGEGLVKRSLFTDSELAVLVFRRVVIITSIDAGALRGDMADRLFIVELERIDEQQRLDDADLEAEFLRLRPRILGALLDLAAKVFAAMPSVWLTARPRMADFARVLGGVDAVLGTKSVEVFMQQAGRIAATVIEADPLAEAICRFAREQGNWEGTVGALFERITPAARPADWPKSPKGMGGKLRRLAPVLRKVGIELVVPKPTDKRRLYSLRLVQNGSESTAPTAQPPTNPVAATSDGDLDRAIEDATAHNSPSNSPAENPAQTPESGHCGRLGDWGGRNAILSAHVHGPPGDCYACGERQWWSITGLMDWTCGGCHDPSMHNGHVIWWIGNGVRR